MTTELSDDQVSLAAKFFSAGFSVSGERYCGEHYEPSDSEQLTDDFRLRLKQHQDGQDITGGVKIEVETSEQA